MLLNQEAIRSFLQSEGGKVRKSDLISKFYEELECDDPSEKKQHKELFRTLVNNVAVVRKINGSQYVVLNDQKDFLVESDTQVKEGETKETPLTDEQQHPLEQDKHDSFFQTGRDQDQEQESRTDEESSELTSPILQALRRSKCSALRAKKLKDVDKEEPDKDDPPIRVENKSSNEAEILKSKPYALPLRMPPSTKVEVQKLKGESSQPPQSPKLDRYNRRLPSEEVTTSSVSPQLRRAMRFSKSPEEPKDLKISSLVPLDHAEHEFLVKCASGHWSQVYGLLLKDHHLVEKKDFMSGFTVLHWAAKCGNFQMLVDIMKMSQQERMKVDINVKSYGGYTPLHIAALHDQECIMNMLVEDYGADVSVRDNRGKKAHHYLQKNKIRTVKERQEEGKIHHDKEETELLPELPKGFHSISRLFQPNLTGHKKKQKHRPELYSLGNDPIDEEEEGGFRHRLSSGVFM